jgi:hypothetical protein
VSIAEVDAIGEMTQGRRHAAVHILGVGETAQRARLPFRRVDPPRRFERAFVFVATRRQFTANEMEVAAKIVNLRQRAIIEVRGRQRFGLRQGGKGVVQAGYEAICRRASEKSPTPVRLGAAR